MQSDGTEKELVMLAVKDPGYYEVAVYVKNAGGKQYLDRTSIAVVEDTKLTATSETSRFGVNTHISQGYENNSVELIGDEIKKLGVKNIRDGYYWNQMSKQEGITDAPKTNVMDAAKENGLGSYITGGFGNGVYMTSEEIAPETEKSINAFADYAIKLYETYEDRGAVMDTFEVWNEYWGGSWYKANVNSGTDETYATFFNGVAEKLYARYPNASLAIGFIGCDENSWNNWDDSVLKRSGITDNVKRATLHEYGPVEKTESSAEARPEITGALQGYDRLRSTLDNNGLKDMKIWLTETGYSSLPNDINGNTIVVNNGNLNTHSNKYCVTEAEAAMYMPRLLLIALSKGVDRIYTYQMIDRHLGNSTHESFYGLLRSGDTDYGLYSPKPQYVSYAVLIRELDGMQYKALSTDGDIYRYEFEGSDGKEVSVLFSVDGTETYEYETDSEVVVTDIMGRKKTMQPSNGKIKLTVDGNVQYITTSK